MQTDHARHPAAALWPFLAAIGIFCVLSGLVLWVNHLRWGPALVAGGGVVLARQIYGWFSDVLGETLRGDHDAAAETSFRHGMISFILSEAFLFLALFFSLLYVRWAVLPALGQGATLWPDVGAIAGAGGIPLWNTLLLLASGMTVTWAHHALRHDRRGVVLFALGLTLLLAAVFLGLQTYEYLYVHYVAGVSLGTGIYGSLFFVMTGLHGLHVVVGAGMLIAVLVRVARGQFVTGSRFGFDAAAWYWHFVDVVWIGIYGFFYLL